MTNYARLPNCLKKYYASFKTKFLLSEIALPLQKWHQQCLIKVVKFRWYKNIWQCCKQMLYICSNLLHNKLLQVSEYGPIITVHVKVCSLSSLHRSFSGSLFHLNNTWIPYYIHVYIHMDLLSFFWFLSSTCFFYFVKL
jgi:hypothetical protein